MPDDSTFREIIVTLFFSRGGSKESERTYKVDELRAEILKTSKGSKDALPWLKLARFGEAKTDKGSLRHDANVLAITGIEADYDGEVMTPAEAFQTLEKAGIRSLVYTSPSHKNEKPRWRVLCPTSAELPPDRRAHLVGRLNGLFAGILAVESFTLSQAYYFGRVNENPLHSAEWVDGRPIDLCDELDASWIGKPHAQSAVSAGAGAGHKGPLDVKAALREITEGKSYHPNFLRLAGHFARNGLPYVEARLTLMAAMDEVFPPDRDERWQSRKSEIDQILEGIYGKDALTRANRGARTSSKLSDAPTMDGAWPEPIDFLADADLTGVPLLRPEHLPDALYPFVQDIAVRLGVDAASVALIALVCCASVTDDSWCVQPKVQDYTWVENPR
jgi:hypothetical protein